MFTGKKGRAFVIAIGPPDFQAGAPEEDQQAVAVNTADKTESF
jgi:hypothetical protein